MPEINTTYSGDSEERTAVIEITEGTVGLDNFNQLKETIKHELNNGTKSFVFDMKNLTSINSSGLGILISSLKKIKESKGSLKLVNTSEKISDIFRLTKLDNVFEF